MKYILSFISLHWSGTFQLRCSEFLTEETKGEKTEEREKYQATASVFTAELHKLTTTNTNRCEQRWSCTLTNKNKSLKRQKILSCGASFKETQLWLLSKCKICWHCWLLLPLWSPSCWSRLLILHEAPNRVPKNVLDSAPLGKMFILQFVKTNQNHN